MTTKTRTFVVHSATAAMARLRKPVSVQKGRDGYWYISIDGDTSVLFPKRTRKNAVAAAEAYAAAHASHFQFIRQGSQS
jgi:hypothetical protein